MQNQSIACAYHDTPPMHYPTDGWKRLEIHELTEVDPILRRLIAEMKALGYPRKDTFAVGLVLLEAVRNAIRHGHRGDKTLSVEINYHLIRTEVLIEVIDQGPGFDPNLVSNPLGENQEAGRLRRWGLLLMRVYMTWIRFNQRGNRVTLCKRRSAR
jgi:anti-sigma regulatory factor (Ser/Thr protein kinase)